MSKNTTLPLVSIIIPSYNASQFLRKSLLSCLNQTYQNIEILLIDDGSTDNTKEICDEFINSEKFRYIKNEKNLGLIFTLNKAIDLARGHFIARMDADDISLPTRIEKQVAILSKNPNIDIVGTDIILIDESDNKKGKPRELPLSPEEIEWAMIASCPLHHPTVMFRNKVHYSVEERHVEDIGLWARVLLSGKKIFIIDEVLLLYRKHSQSITSIHGNAQTKASASMSALFAKKRWNLDIDPHFLLLVRSRQSFSDETFFIEANNVIEGLKANGYNKIASAAQQYLQVMCLTYLHTFFLIKESNKARAFIYTLTFLLAPARLSTLPTAFFKFYKSMLRKLAR